MTEVVIIKLMADDIQLKTPPIKSSTFTKTYADEIDVDAKDLELMESRVVEIERYLGIEDMDLQYFYANDGEDLNKKS